MASPPADSRKCGAAKKREKFFAYAQLFPLFPLAKFVSFYAYKETQELSPFIRLLQCKIQAKFFPRFIRQQKELHFWRKLLQKHLSCLDQPSKATSTADELIDPTHAQTFIRMKISSKKSWQNIAKRSRIDRLFTPELSRGRDYNSSFDLAATIILMCIDLQCVTYSTVQKCCRRARARARAPRARPRRPALARAPRPSLLLLLRRLRLRQCGEKRLRGKKNLASFLFIFFSSSSSLILCVRKKLGICKKKLCSCLCWSESAFLRRRSEREKILKPFFLY